MSSALEVMSISKIVGWVAVEYFTVYPRVGVDDVSHDTPHLDGCQELEIYAEMFAGQRSPELIDGRGNRVNSET